MVFQYSAPVPPPSDLIFRDGISHPDLWLWDAWTCYSGDQLSLFTLALSRRQDNGSEIPPGARNDFKFHIRRFSSSDDGVSWRDCGCYLGPSDAAGGVLSRNVWSGSAAPYNDSLLFGFTGVRQPNINRPFVQSICATLAPIDLSSPDSDDIIVLSDPSTEYDAIRAKGYYLGAKDTLGDANGEDGGPILAWRDPFFLVDAEGGVDAFWSAKVGPTTPAIAHARLDWQGESFSVALQAPIPLPDSAAYTQAEVPKVYYDASSGIFYLLVSTCNRLREGQPDTEVSKQLRLYVSESPTGDWRPYRHDGSIIPNVDGLFGASLAFCDFEAGVATLIGPYTEMVTLIDSSHLRRPSASICQRRIWQA